MLTIGMLHGLQGLLQERYVDLEEDEGVKLADGRYVCELTDA